jgi:hypothetical protein
MNYNKEIVHAIIYKPYTIHGTNIIKASTVANEKVMVIAEQRKNSSNFPFVAEK